MARDTIIRGTGMQVQYNYVTLYMKLDILCLEFSLMMSGTFALSWRV